MSMDKKFNYSKKDMDQIYSGINSLFALEALSEDEEDDLEDYDPENDSDEDIDDDDYDEEIDGDTDPAEDEDDEYDDVVEHIGIDNMEEFLSADELDAEDLMVARAVESAIDVAFAKSVVDQEHSVKFEDDDADDIYGIDFSDDDLKDDELFDDDYFNE